MYEDPIQLSSVSRFRVHSEDPSFHVTWRGGSRFALSGEVSLDPSAGLDVSTPDNQVEISLARRSTPEHAVAMLRRALPRSISMRHTQVEDGVEVVFQEALVPAAKTPRFRIFSSGAVLRVKQLDENKIEFTGGLGAETRAESAKIRGDVRGWARRAKGPGQEKRLRFAYGAPGSLAKENVMT